MNSERTFKVKLRISESWDSTKEIIGTFNGEVHVENLQSALILTDSQQWIALLPRYKEQNILTEIIHSKDTATNIVWLSKQFDPSMKQISKEFIVDYDNGEVTRLD